MEAKNLVCFSCKHWRENAMGCEAFPEGIPDEITGGQNRHKKPLPGQENDLVYEKA